MMDGGQIALIIGSLANLVGVIGGVFVSLRNGRKTDQVVAKVEEVHTRVETVERATNGLTKALGAAKLAQGTAEGMAIGLKEGTAAALKKGQEQQTVEERRARDRPTGGSS